MLSQSHLSRGALLMAELLLMTAVGQSATAQDLSDLLQRARQGTGLPASPLARLGGFSDWVTSLAFSPDGATLAAGTYEEVKLFDTGTRKEQKSLKISGYARGLAFSADGKLLAAGGYQVVLLWDTDGASAPRRLKGHRSYVTGASFSPDGKRLVTSGADETIRLWDTASGKQTQEIRGHAYPVTDVTFSPDGTLLASVAGDETRVTQPGEVKIWDAATGKEIHNLVVHEKAASSVAFSLDGRYLASTGEDEKVNVYEVATGKALGYFNGHGRPTNDVLFAAGGETIVSAGGGRAQGKNDIKIWNRADGEERATFSGHKGQVACLALSPDGKLLASGSYDESVLLWDVAKLLGRPAAAAAGRPVLAPVP